MTDENQQILKYYIDTNADWISTNKCPSTENTNTNTVKL